MATPVLHGVHASPFVRKVRVVLAEKGIAYDHVPRMPLGPDPEYRRISPLGKIPAWEEGEFAVPDSSVICAYLERLHPDPPLYPADARGYARALWLEEYADTKLAETAGPVFFERVVKARFLKQAPDEDRIERQRSGALPPVLDYLESQVGEGAALVGDRFGIADVAVATHLQNLRHAGVELDAARWPKLARWFEGVASRPAFRACVEEEEKLLASAGA